MYYYSVSLKLYQTGVLNVDSVLNNNLQWLVSDVLAAVKLRAVEVSREDLAVSR